MICETTSPRGGIHLSVVIPVYNEEGNVAALAREVLSVLCEAGYEYEVLFVDDASGDGTVAQVSELEEVDGRIRLLRHRVNCGQSAAIATGLRNARGTWIATLDGDGQNDPADLPRMLARAETERVDCVSGIRVKRQDTRMKKISSRIANAFRNVITGDCIADSGCGIRILRRDSIGEIPVFNGMHRFLPTLMRAQGLRIVQEDVNHRSRKYGITKYGVHNRLWRGIGDCFAVRWYRRRAVPAPGLRIGIGEEPGTGAPPPGESSGGGTGGGSRRLLILLAVALVVFLLHHFGPLQAPMEKVRGVMADLEGRMVTMGVVFFSVTFLMVALGVPRLLFFVLGGFFFNFWPGLILAISGVMGGAFATFHFVRWCGRDWVRKRFDDTAIFRKVLPQSSTAWSVFFARQLPLSCFFVNTGLALSPVGSGAFVLGSLLGFLPQGIIAALIGSGLAEDGFMEGVAELTAAAFFLFAIMFFSWHWRRRRRRARPDR